MLHPPGFMEVRVNVFLKPRAVFRIGNELHIGAKGWHVLAYAAYKSRARLNRPKRRRRTFTPRTRT